MANEKENTTPHKMVSLFAGIGGFELGFKQAGIETALVCEIDPIAQHVLKAKMKDVDVVSDVCDLKELPHDADILCAGFPCQDISTIGGKVGLSGERSSLVKEVFRLLKKKKVEWVIFENVSNMLYLRKGEAIKTIVEELEQLGYQWAYRMVDSLAFVPQKRRRVFVVASLHHDPRNVILSEDSGIEPGVITSSEFDAPCGFYWTEGKYAIGLYQNAIPTLKVGSSIGIPSPPAIAFPDGTVGSPDIRDAERLQGFPVDWTKPAEELTKPNGRWKLVGNAVTVDVAAWIAKKIIEPVPYDSSKDKELKGAHKWPSAAWGSNGKRYAAMVSQFPVAREEVSLTNYLLYPCKALSYKAAKGFESRLNSGTVRCPQFFSEAIHEYVVKKEEKKMTEKTLDAFKDTLGVLIDSNPHARNKGDEFKDWIKEHFGCDARISYIKEQRQITNRVSEQFRYFAPIVVFVCVPEVKRDTLARYILERDYKQLESVAIIGATVSETGEKDYSFEQLITFKHSDFIDWISSNFDQVKEAAALKEELGISSDEAGNETEADVCVDESTRIKGGTNILLYGVPGSGKSWTIEHEYCTPGTRVERLVFHPDYTNADFIGQILPVVDPVDKMVTYEFTPGPFTNIVRDAYLNPKDRYVLIIEEVNRGNAPAIFGDVFQLLDRLVEPKTIEGVTYLPGTSEYGITNPNIAKVVYGDGTHKVRIPSNLSILGTMNTSDQNVFTLDTAFQRRWRMRLIENTFDNVRLSLADAPILDTGVTWKKFCEEINKLVIGNKSKMASAEDKRLGVYFIHESDLAFDANGVPSDGYNTLTEELNVLLKKEREDDISDDEKERLKAIRIAVIQNRVFPEKVIKYLWDDAFKFNPEAAFDTEKMESLEQVIRAFVYDNVGANRFDIFKTTLRQALYSNAQ